MDRAETSKNIQRVLRIGCIAALLALVFIGLAPQRFVPRSGFGWEIDQFVGYFVITLMLCLAWPRPVVVGVALMVFAVLLEALQAFPPDRSWGRWLCCWKAYKPLRPIAMPTSKPHA
jgi:VanZ family protein